MTTATTITTIFFKTPYAGVQGEAQIKNLVKNPKRHLEKSFVLRNIYCNKKLRYYCDSNDKMPHCVKSHIE